MGHDQIEHYRGHELLSGAISDFEFGLDSINMRLKFTVEQGTQDDAFTVVEYIAPRKLEGRPREKQIANSIGIEQSADVTVVRGIYLGMLSWGERHNCPQ